MKDSLKDFIHQNRAGFDDKTPGEKTWNRIEVNLPMGKTISLWNSVSVWRAAAILFLGLASYFFVTSNQSAFQKKEVVALQGEFSDLELFYSSEIAEKVALINHFDQSRESNQVTQDFQKLDAMYQVLKEQMKIEPTQKVRDALVLNLLVRIDLLNQQLHALERIKTDSAKKERSPAKSWFVRVAVVGRSSKRRHPLDCQTPLQCVHRQAAVSTHPASPHKWPRQCAD